MADYISILDKAVTGLGENSPENRAIIFDKARAAIERKLRAMDPVPPEDAIARQLGQLENAISEVDGRYAAAPPEAEPILEPEPVVEPVAPVQEQPVAQAAEPTPEPAIMQAAPQEPISQEPPPQETIVPDGFIDEITLIDGIGAKTAGLLADEGITGISQIAAMDDQTLAVLTEKIGFAGFEITQEWKLQASEMLGGALPRSKTGQTNLAKLQKDAGPVETVAAPVEQGAVEPTPSEPNLVPAAHEAEAIIEPEPIPAQASAAPEIAVPHVTEPVVNQPVLDNSNVDSAGSAPDTPGQSVDTAAVVETPIASEAGESSLAETADEDSREAFEAQFKELVSQQAGAEQVIPEHTIPEQAGMTAPAPQAPEPRFVSELENDPAHSPVRDPYLERSVQVAPSKKGGSGKVVGTGLIVLLLGAAAAGAYVYKDRLVELGNQGIEAVQELISVKKVEPVKTEPAVVESSDAVEKAEPVAKDTTRLSSDGSETQESATTEIETVSEPVSAPEPVVEAPITPVVEEPEIPATVEVEEETPTAAEVETVEAAPSEPSAVEEVAPQPAVLNGEKSFLYEEALGSTGANRDEGSIVWTLVTEPPETGAAPEPVIKAMMEIPSRGLTLNMAIKRNVDAGLPASHIIELFFTAPAEFSGGNIDGVSRFVMKSTEQARGESLVGVPARIDTGFFLIALNNLAQAQKTNLNLLENSDWIDIPVSYVTGRRALLTFEKGASGKEVFSQALADWKNR